MRRTKSVPMNQASNSHGSDGWVDSILDALVRVNQVAKEVSSREDVETLYLIKSKLIGIIMSHDSGSLVVSNYQSYHGRPTVLVTIRGINGPTRCFHMPIEEFQSLKQSLDAKSK